MFRAARVKTVGVKEGLELGGWSPERVYRMVGGTRWVGGVSVVWAEKRRSTAMTTEGGVEVMTTEGGVEVQLERERKGRRRASEGSARTFIGPATQGGGHPEKRCRHPNRAL